MTWQYVYRLTMMKARGVRTMVRTHCHPQVDLLAAKFPPSNSDKIAIQAYRAIFASDLLFNWEATAHPEMDRADYNFKSNS